MDALISVLPGWLQQVNGWEILAVLLGLAYLLLAMREWEIGAFIKLRRK